MGSTRYNSSVVGFSSLSGMVHSLAERENRTVDVMPNNPCSIKSQLLRKYMGKLDALYYSVQDSAAIVDAGPDRIQLINANRRVEENRRESRAARSQYTDHVHDHGC